jgi:hypothetical protein
MTTKKAPIRPMNVERIFCYLYRSEVYPRRYFKQGKPRVRNLFTWCHMPVNYARRVPVEILFTVKRNGVRFLDYVFPLEKIIPTGNKEIDSFKQALKMLTGSNIDKNRIDWGYAV